ncbi:MAG: hypothetical protein ACXVOH_07440 [Bacteroidia bacterium]
MKKGLSVLIVFVSTLFCACNKQYTCECKVTGGSNSTFVISASKQSDAASKCATYSNTSSASAPSTCALR